MKDYGLSRTIRSLAAPKQVSLIGSQTSLNVMLLVIEHPHIEGYQFAGSELTRLLNARLQKYMLMLCLPYSLDKYKLRRVPTRGCIMHSSFCG